MTITLAGSGDTKLIQRSEWNARTPDYVTPFTAEFGGTCHWEGLGMPDFSHGACASYVRGIQNYHMDAKGWSDIAYTAVVCPHGYVFEGRWIGRRTGANGTNIGNDSAYAVCFLGGEGDPYTPAAHRAMHDTMTHLRLHGKAGPKVNCHRDWKSTACPGDVICGHVKAGHYTSNAKPSTPATPKPPTTKEDVMRARIIWFKGEPTAPGDQPDTTAAYKVIEAQAPDGQWFSVSATHVVNQGHLDILTYTGIEEVKAPAGGSKKAPLPIKDWAAGLAFFNGPFRNT